MTRPVMTMEQVPLRKTTGTVILSMLSSSHRSRNTTDAMVVTRSPISSSDSRRTADSYAHLTLGAALAWLAWVAFRNELGYIPLLGDIDLAIHEFGHMLFMPFGIPFLGRTMVILGGSLTQVAFPLLFVGYFLKKREDGQRRDVFAALVCLWWSGINLLDVAIYCADSRAGELMLLDGLTGKESDGHDWYNLLDGWGLLEQDTAIARWMRGIAFILCVGSIIVAVWTALQQPRAQPAEVVSEV